VAGADLVGYACQFLERLDGVADDQSCGEEQNENRKSGQSGDKADDRESTALEVLLLYSDPQSANLSIG
jgi:hypothetical protein